jgi:hypothetical protein
MKKRQDQADCRSLILFFKGLQMEFMQEPMEYRCDENAGDQEENDARKKRVKGSEPFTPGSLERADRPHASKDHRGVEKRIQPGQILREMIAEDSNPKRNGDNPYASQTVIEQSPDEQLFR